MEPVIIESPYAGNVSENLRYARAVARHCLLNGMAPYASHLLFTQLGILDDLIPEERTLGIEAGLLWGRFAAKSIVAIDRGMSRGMQYGIDRAEKEGRPVITLNLPGWESQAADPEREAKIAYKAYGDSVEWKNYQGLPMPTWETLPEKIRTAWCAAAAALTK